MLAHWTCRRPPPRPRPDTSSRALPPARRLLRPSTRARRLAKTSCPHGTASLWSSWPRAKTTTGFALVLGKARGCKRNACDAPLVDCNHNLVRQVAVLEQRKRGGGEAHVRDGRRPHLVRTRRCRRQRVRLGAR